MNGKATEVKTNTFVLLLKKALIAEFTHYNFASFQSFQCINKTHLLVSKEMTMLFLYTCSLPKQTIKHNTI